jgi:hypothetical protein
MGTFFFKFITAKLGPFSTKDENDQVDRNLKAKPKGRGSVLSDIHFDYSLCI